jgi:glutamate decarboxylase
VRRGFTFDVADMLLADLRKQVGRLEKLPAPLVPRDQGGGFHH